jgi:hypothetical protein
MSVKYEVLAATGTYTDKQGNEKKRWLKCGVVMETKKGGLALRLEALPVSTDGWFMLTEPKEYEPKPSAKTAIADLDSDVPF